jgi:hypothetical protein
MTVPLSPGDPIRLGTTKYWVGWDEAARELHT